MAHTVAALAYGHACLASDTRLAELAYANARADLATVATGAYPRLVAHGGCAPAPNTDGGAASHRRAANRTTRTYAGSTYRALNHGGCTRPELVAGAARVAD